MSPLLLLLLFVSLHSFTVATPRINDNERERSQASSRDETNTPHQELVQELVLEGIPLQATDNPHGVLHFQPQPFNTYNPHTGQHQEIDHEDDHNEGAYPINLDHDGPLAYLARRMQAYRARRRGTYIGDYRSDRDEDFSRHRAMAAISGLGSNGTGSFFHLRDGVATIYYNQTRPLSEVIEQYNHNALSMLYEDQERRLHFIDPDNPEYQEILA